MLVTETSIKAIPLQQISCIWYPVQFQGDKIQALTNSGTKINKITSIFAVKLSFVTQKTDIGTQKLDGLLLATYEMVLAGFSIQDKFGKIWFFEKTFLLAETSMVIVLRMLFFTFSNTDVQFGEKKLK